MKALDVVTLVLVIVGAVNWGLVALAEFDLVATVFGMRFGETNALSALVYGLVALSGLYQAAQIPSRAALSTRDARSGQAARA